MKLSNPRAFNRPTVIQPPVPLERMATPKFGKDQVQTFKCRNDPAEPSSAQYDITVPFFSTGTPEEWIYFQRCLRRAMIGQGDGDGAKKYA